MDLTHASCPRTSYMAHVLSMRTILSLFAVDSHSHLQKYLRGILAVELNLLILMLHLKCKLSV